MTTSDFALARARFAKDITWLAMTHSGGDDDLADDLEQAAFIALWEMDAEHVFSGPRVWVRILLHWRMIDFLRWMNLRGTWPLTDSLCFPSFGAIAE